MTESSAYSLVKSFGFPRNRVPILESNYPHIKEVNNRLQELVRLEQGWDGYKGEPVTLENANFAIRMLECLCFYNTPVPQIVPGVSGDLQVEWHTSSIKIELHVVSPNNVYFWTNDQSICKDDEEKHLTTDFKIVLEKIEKLTKLTEQLYDKVATR